MPWIVPWNSGEIDMNVKLECPFDGRPCTRAGCEQCQVKIDAMVKIREGENIEDYWKHQNSGAE